MLLFDPLCGLTGSIILADSEDIVKAVDSQERYQFQRMREVVNPPNSKNNYKSIDSYICDVNPVD